jgi:hypothetical protein
MLPARGIIALKAHSDQWLMTPYDVRFGSKADVGLPAVDVRFTPESGHC